jgi:hypothetical protein
VVKSISSAKAYLASQGTHIFNMLQSLPLAGLAFASLGQARFARLHPRMGADECCPCPQAGQPNQGASTVTVTQPAPPAVTTTVTAPEKTVIVQQTVTAPANTVYVTQAPSSEPMTQAIAPEVSSQPAGSEQAPQVVTITTSSGSQPSQSESQSMPTSTWTDVNPSSSVGTSGTVIISVNSGEGQTYTITPGASPSSAESNVNSGEAQTYTITPGASPASAESSVHSGEGQTYTITQGASPSFAESSVSSGTEMSTESGQTPAITSITQVASESPAPQSPAPEATTVVQEPAQELFVTKTIIGSVPQEEQPAQTVTVAPVTTVQTLTLAGGSTVVQTVETSELVTVTASPQTQTQTVSVTQGAVSYQTVTQTVSSGTNIDVQIIIINLNTGEATCRMQKSGKPCSPAGSAGAMPNSKQPGSSPATTTVCASVAAHTSIATVFNTVLVTANSTMKWNATAMSGVALPSGTGMLTARRPRAPASLRW